MSYSYSAPDLRELRETMAVCARPRYAHAVDPHDGNDVPGEPAIRVVDYMGDYDTYYTTQLVGPYPNAAARDADLGRLRRLTLGRPEFHGGYEFLASTMGAANADPEAEVVAPQQVAEATTVAAFFAAFKGYDEDANEDGALSAVHPGQLALL